MWITILYTCNLYNIVHQWYFNKFFKNINDANWYAITIFSSVQSLSHVWLFVTPWITARQVSLSITNSQSSPRLTSIESVMPSSHLILCRPLLFLLPIPPSIRVFSNESALRMRWPKYWSFSFSIIPSKEIPGLISFRMDWLENPLGWVKNKKEALTQVWLSNKYWADAGQAEVTTHRPDKDQEAWTWDKERGSMISDI